MPEPLSKVLEPSVSVTYLDQSQSSDADEFLRASKYMEPVINEDDEDAATTENEPQKDETKVEGAKEGPLIYKLQKTGTENQGEWCFSSHENDYFSCFFFVDVMSPIRDPAVTRNRFEGLLEGAIQFYSEHVEERGGGPGTPEIVSSAAMYAAKIRENRGKSAVLPFR